MQVTYRVLYKERDTKVTRHFNTFAAAAGTAGALGCVCWLGAEIKDQGGSHSGSMYKYDIHGNRQVVNKGFIASVTHELNK